jgi:hypothetical protein
VKRKYAYTSRDRRRLVDRNYPAYDRGFIHHIPGRREGQMTLIVWLGIILIIGAFVLLVVKVIITKSFPLSWILLAGVVALVGIGIIYLYSPDFHAFVKGLLSP